MLRRTKPDALSKINRRRSAFRSEFTRFEGRLLSRDYPSVPSICAVLKRQLSHDTNQCRVGGVCLSGKAELVGLLFDGVYESIIGDWDYDKNLNRSIHVDSRYMLWVMDKVDNAQNLLDEMKIVK